MRDIISWYYNAGNTRAATCATALCVAWFALLLLYIVVTRHYVIGTNTETQSLLSSAPTTRRLLNAIVVMLGCTLSLLGIVHCVVVLELRASGRLASGATDFRYAVSPLILLGSTYWIFVRAYWHEWASIAPLFEIRTWKCGSVIVMIYRSRIGNHIKYEMTLVGMQVRESMRVRSADDVKRMLVGHGIVPSQIQMSEIYTFMS